jgi:Ca2+-transporting ATPase
MAVLAQLAALYTPFLQKVLHTTPLSLSEWLIIIPIAASIILVEEMRKFIFRKLKS